MLRFHPLKVAELRVEPEEAIYLTLAVPAALCGEYRFAAGQHIGLRVMLGGEELRRTYSLVNASDEDALQIAVRLHGRGRMSEYLVRDVRVGDTLEVLTPNGSFHSRLDTQRGANRGRIRCRLRHHAGHVDRADAPAHDAGQPDAALLR